MNPYWYHLSFILVVIVVLNKLVLMAMLKVLSFLFFPNISKIQIFLSTIKHAKVAGFIKISNKTAISMSPKSKGSPKSMKTTSALSKSTSMKNRL